MKIRITQYDKHYHIVRRWQLDLIDDRLSRVGHQAFLDACKVGTDEDCTFKITFVDEKE